MNAKYVLIAFLSTLTAMVLIVLFGVLAVAFHLKNPEAFSVLASAITGLTAVAIQFRPGKREGDDK
jgi:hypothetical protein